MNHNLLTTFLLQIQKVPTTNTNLASKQRSYPWKSQSILYRQPFWKAYSSSHKIHSYTDWTALI